MLRHFSANKFLELGMYIINKTKLHCIKNLRMIIRVVVDSVLITKIQEVHGVPETFFINLLNFVKSGYECFKNIYPSFRIELLVTSV